VAGVLEAETTTFSLDDAVTAYQELRAGRVHGRAVVIP
jgi:propanol-preferring alcohol dehydrogenase